ncbi:SDR family oxidoreductase [Vallicoccus soli]|uniref:SDR family oxidoreductase n=1 Tax=Vallicoccus soli TaxID=2339232 RepID=A0A3A3ZHZ5_9ACTN|nr:SDR family oxidoreductase [Vallicoccus soli]
MLVAGVGGVIGRHAAIEHARRGHRVVGVSRRRPSDLPEGVEHRAVDLSSPGALDGVDDVTHLVFAAYVEAGPPAALVAPNVALLEGALDLAQRHGRLQHVTLYQGGKAYGAHLGAFRTPAKESDPRLLAPNFYYAQEDVLRGRGERDGFAVTMLRPEAVIGYATGNPMNLLMAVAAYGTVCAATGTPLAFPGTREAYGALYQSTDAELLGRATVWAGESPAADGEVFNVTNGDQYRWENLWPRLADAFGVDVGHPLRTPLVDAMADKEPVWRRLVDRYGLRPTPWDDLVQWPFADFIWSSGFDNVSSTVKLRQAGFGECLDSEDRYVELLERLRAERVLPPRGARA